MVLLGWGISSSQGLYLHTGQHKQNKHTETFMPRLGFKPITIAFELAKRVHALDRADSVIGIFVISIRQDVEIIVCLIN
jgi:hypothetical protein